MDLALRSLPFLWGGLLVTLHVSLLVVTFSLAAGVLLGVGIAYGPRWLAVPGAASGRPELAGWEPARLAPGAQPS